MQGENTRPVLSSEGAGLIFNIIGDCFAIPIILKMLRYRCVHFFMKQTKGRENMRLDKYLKVSRLIKRRTVANEACDAGRVLINGKPAKASANVKEGDILTIQFGNKEVKVEVLDVQETVRKEEAKELFKYL